MVVAGFVLIMLIAPPFRFRSQRPARHSTPPEGITIMITLRMRACPRASAIAFMISPTSMAWASLPFPAWLRWTGAALARYAAACSGRCAARTNLTDTVARDKRTRWSRAVRIGGSRHPFYDCMRSVTLSMVMMSAKGFVSAAGVAVFGLLAARSRQRI